MASRHKEKNGEEKEDPIPLSSGCLDAASEE
jgi:hypothetical protein